MKRLGVLILCLFLCACTAQNRDTSSPAAEGASSIPAESSTGVEDVPSPQEDLASPLSALYGRSLLSEQEQQVYDDLYHAAQALDFGAEIPVPAGVVDDGLQRIVQYFHYDNPAFYWAQPQVIVAGDRLLVLETAEELDEDTVRRRHQELMEKTEKLTASLEDEDGFTAVLRLHDRLANNTYYSTNIHQEDAGNAYGGLVNGSAICDGYAKGFQHLVQSMGIPCVYIYGTDIKGVPHAWNAVLLEGAWYYVDVTYDDKLPLRHDYLNMTSEESERERIWNDTQYPALPVGDALTYNYYVHRGYTVEDGSIDEIVHGLAKAFATQVADRVDVPDGNAVFLEIKVLGDAEQYQRVKEIFLSYVFDVLAEMDPLLAELRDDLLVVEEQMVYCNANDPIQVLIFYPRIAMRW